MKSKYIPVASQAGKAAICKSISQFPEEKYILYYQSLENEDIIDLLIIDTIATPQKQVKDYFRTRANGSACFLFPRIKLAGSTNIYMPAISRAMFEYEMYIRKGDWKLVYK